MNSTLSHHSQNCSVIILGLSSGMMFPSFFQCKHQIWKALLRIFFPYLLETSLWKPFYFTNVFYLQKVVISTGLLKKLKEKQATSTSHIPLTLSAKESVSGTVFYLIVLMWDGFVQLGAVQSSGTQLAGWPSAGGNLQHAASCTAQDTTANLWRSIPHR